MSKQTHLPSKTPLSQWPRGWLIMEVAGITGLGGYMLMTDDERRGRDLPVTEAEMRTFIAIHRGIN